MRREEEHDAKPVPSGRRGRFLVAASVARAPVRSRRAPPDAETSFNSGLQHLRENRPQMALEEFKKAVKQDDKSPYFQKGLGLAYSQLRKYDEAIAAFRRALVINPYYVDVRNDLGAALVLSGKRTEGRAEWVAAYNEPTNPTPDLSARNLGQSYLEENNFQEAANWFRSSLGKNPKQVDAYTGLAAALSGLQRPEEAVPVLEAALKEAPGETGAAARAGRRALPGGPLHRGAGAARRGDQEGRRLARGPPGHGDAEALPPLRASRQRRPRDHPEGTRDRGSFLDRFKQGLSRTRDILNADVEDLAARPPAAGAGGPRRDRGGAHRRRLGPARDAGGDGGAARAQRARSGRGGRDGHARAAARRDPRSAGAAARGARPSPRGPGSCSWSGVNGVGKTTTIGKLAARLEGARAARTLLCAADTFRAAAAEQLEVWAAAHGRRPSTAAPRGPTRRRCSPTACARRAAAATTRCWSTPPAACTPRAT